MTYKNVNRRNFLQGAATAAIATGVGVGRSLASTKIKLRLGHQLGSTHPTYKAIAKMAKAIESRTNGDVAIEVFPNGVLGSPPDMVKQAQMGALDFVMFNPPNIVSEDRTASVIQIPYQFDGYAHAHRTLNGTARSWLMDFFKRNSLQWVANYEYGFRSVSNSKRPILMPKDVTGLKLRVPPEFSIKATFDALGANTQTIAFDELYLALSSGVVDGQDNPISVDYANKFYQVQKYVAATHHIYTSYMLSANPSRWNSLPTDVRTIISEEAIKWGKYAQTAVQHGEGEFLAQMKKTGVKVTRPEPKPFRDKMGPAWDAMRKRIGDAAWKEWMGFVEAARTA